MRSINVRLIWRVARIFLIVYGLLLILMLLFENSLLYRTSKFPEGDWEPKGLAYEDAWFKAADGTQLHGWFAPCDSPRAVALFAHGNAGNVTDRADFLREMHRLGVAVLAFDYRGYGRSSGNPNEAGILADGRAARKWLADHTETPESEIVLMGESLGGGVAVQLAAETPARGLVLENTFSSLPDVAAAHYPWIPVKQLMRTQLDSADAVKNYHGPLLQFHGDADTIVPFKLGRKLFDTANDPKKFVIIPGGDHNDPRTPKYYQAVDRFLNQLPPKRAANITLKKNQTNKSVLPAERVQTSQPPIVPELHQSQPTRPELHEDKSSGASPSEKAPDQDMIKSLEESLLYFPSKFPAGNWSPAGLRFEDAWFKAADGTQLHGWFVPCDKPRAVALFAHGNGGNLSDRADILRDLHRLGVDVLAFDYRGYGRSSGAPNEAGINADGRAARTWLAERAKIPESEIVLMGESLGGAVAVQLASEAPAWGLVLENTFSSAPDVAAFHYPWLPVKQLMRTQLDSVTAIKKYTGPLLQFHGDADTIVPFKLGRKLFDAANEPKQLVVIPGGDHNDPHTPKFFAVLDQFLNQLPSTQTVR